MAGVPLKYVAWDLEEWVELDPLPYAGVSFGETINTPGPFSGTLAIADPRVYRFDWASATRTGRTALFVDQGGTLIWGGIIWTRQWDEFSVPQLLAISANTFGSWLGSRLQANDYTSTFAAGADPMVVTETLMNDALAVDNLAGGITVVLNPIGGSGQSVSVSYPNTQLQTLNSIFTTLSGMGYTYGYDFSFDCEYISGTTEPQVVMNIWYPRQGDTAEVSGLLVMHRQVIGFSYDEDSTKQFTEITETGSGSGGIQPAPVSVDIPGYPALQAVKSRAQITDQGVLQNVAVGDVAMAAYPVTTPTLSLPLPLPDPVNFPDEPGFLNPAMIGFGDFNLGDDLIHVISPVPLDANGIASYGLMNSPRFPAGYRFEWRIVQWTATVADSGQSAILFDLAVPPSSTLPPPAPPGI